MISITKILITKKSSVTQILKIKIRPGFITHKISLEMNLNVALHTKRNIKAKQKKKTSFLINYFVLIH